MNDEDRQFLSRMSELAGRARATGRPEYTMFLTIAQQELLRAVKCDETELYGGYDGAERRIACFGPGDPASRVKCLLITPRSERFSEKLGHRDVLGSLMSLGLRRETLGDIVMGGRDIYLFCLTAVAGHIEGALTQVRGTYVSCKAAEGAPDIAAEPPPEKALTVASLRLDAMIAAVYNIPRSQAQERVSRGLAHINGREELSASAELKGGDIVSVRGSGRFKLERLAGENRRGRLRCIVRIY